MSEAKNKESIENNNIDYEAWYRKCQNFFLYFTGYVRHSAQPMHKLTTLLSDLEELVFGEIKTKSWH